MTDPLDWQKNSDEHLTAALKWLRLLLLRQANRLRQPVMEIQTGPQTLTLPVPVSEALPSGRWWSRLGRSQAAPAESKPPGQPGWEPPPQPLPPPREIVTDEEIAQTAAAMAEAEAAMPPPVLMLLAQRLGLSRFEREVLLLCAGVELDTRIAGLCAEAQNDERRPYPTFALALALFEEPSWSALSPEQALRYWRLIEISQPGAQPLTTSPLRADERIIHYLKGLNQLDDRLAPLLAPLPSPGIPLPPSHAEAVERVIQELMTIQDAPRLPVVQLLGPDQASKELLAAAIADRLGLQLFRLPAELMPTGAGDVESLARLWHREGLLLPLALYLEAPDAEGSASPALAALHRFLIRSNGVFLVNSRDPLEGYAGVGGGALTLHIEKPTPSEQRNAWAEALGPRAADLPALLASHFSLSLAQIREIARHTPAAPEAREEGEEGDSLADPAADLQARLWDACRISLRPRLEALAMRLEPKATWEDIVLPEEELGLLRQIADQVGQRGTVYEDWGFAEKMNRGLGISALFTGESGTGKTMAAEVIANHLRLDLYRIDLSAVVSKYIGETEKNLRKLFDSVEDGGAILFFDEADALFGKRSEVRDSHDRYANIEVNYLLQRMEGYRGLAILATNMKSALDPAFLRRLRFVVTFPFPGPAERRAMWERSFPSGAPLEGLDYDRLSRFNLAGGHIHTVAVNAAFLAAREKKPLVTMPLVLAAARSEFRKLNRPINEADFRWTAPPATPAQSEPAALPARPLTGAP